MDKDFDEWNKLKKHLDKEVAGPPHFKERKVWYCSIGLNIGSEQNGHHGNFERPVLIVKKINYHTFLGLPLTSQNKKVRYLHIYKSGDKTYNIKLSQIRLWDSKRLLRKMITIPEDDFRDLKSSLRSMFR